MVLDPDIIRRGAEWYVRRAIPEHDQDNLIVALLRRVERDVRLAKILMEAGISPPQAATTLQSSDLTEPSLLATSGIKPKLEKILARL
jgi:DNA-binding phage protein